MPAQSGRHLHDRRSEIPLANAHIIETLLATVEKKDEEITQLKKQILNSQQQELVSAWISVDERLPTVGQHVIAYRPTAHITEDPTICITFYSGIAKTDWQNVEHAFYCLCHPSYWQPMPAPPGGAK